MSANHIAPTPCGMSINEELQAFLQDRDTRQLSPRTIQFYSDELMQWHDWVEDQGPALITTVTTKLLRSWFLHLATRRNKGGVHANYRALRAFLRWVWEENEFDHRNPIERVHLTYPRPDPLPPMPLDDLREILKTCEKKSELGDRDRALLLVLLDTGCRANELLSIHVGDISLGNGAIRIVHGKGDKSRSAYMGRKSRREVRKYLRHRADDSPESPLWATTQGTRLSYAGLRSMVRRRAAKAGVPAPPLHSFRRAFALTSLRNGMDIYSLQRLMGHSDLTMLRRYLRLTDMDLQEAHRRTGPVDNVL
jgi:site-specific recombinase XerD